MSGPDALLAREKYRRQAVGYDRLARLTRRLRARAVDQLALRPGDTVVDVACGTGLTFSYLEQRIGSEGRLIGVDLSLEMLARARERAATEGWPNVVLIEASVEDVRLPVEADAAIFVLTHDVMRSAAGLRNILRQLRPGAQVVTAGAKRPPWWPRPLDGVLDAAMRRYVTTTEGLERPWDVLAELVPDLQVRPLLLGGAYIAWGALDA